MVTRLFLALLLTACAPEPVTRAPNLISVDASLLGVPRDELIARFGTPCLSTPDGLSLAWPRINDTVLMSCSPSPEILGVTLDAQGYTESYYIGLLKWSE